MGPSTTKAARKAAKASGQKKKTTRKEKKTTGKAAATAAARPRLQPAGDCPDAPPRHGPSESYFSKSEFLDPLPSREPPARPPPPVPYVRCANPRPPSRAREDATHGSLPPLPPDRTDMTPERLGFDDEFGGSLGTAVQLLAVGPQNYVLDQNPQATFFRKVWRRHSPCATECFCDATVLRPGGVVTVDLARRGDLLGDVFLEVDLPDLGIPGGAWADAVGYVLLSRLRFSVGELVVHDQERLWYDITDRLLMPEGRLRGLNAMIGRGRRLATDRAHTVVVPLKLACCTGHYHARRPFPIGGLDPTCRLTLEVTTERLAACLDLPAGTAPPAGPPPGLRARVLSEQTFLGDDERLGMAAGPCTLLVETAQDVDALAYRFDDNGVYPSASVNVDLREVNLPVKMLAFVAYDEGDAARGVHFRYLDCVASATVLLGSQELFAPRGGQYFSLVQPYERCGRCAPDRVHAHSFALRAHEWQPSGAINLAVAPDPALRVELRDTGGRPVKVKCFAYCYNWLTLGRGAATLFST